MERRVRRRYDVKIREDSILSRATQVIALEVAFHFALQVSTMGLYQLRGHCKSLAGDIRKLGCL